ncbi:unnamed protein product [Rotaria socialis]
MIKQVSKPDYSKMSEGELRLLLNKHQQMLNNTRLINGLPDRGERLRNAIGEIEKFLATSSSPMDCDTITHQFCQMTMSSKDNEILQQSLRLEKPTRDSIKQRLKARQAERDSKATVTTAKLISLDEAIQLYNEETKRQEEHLVQQTTAKLLGNMSLSKTTFGLPPSTTSKTNLTHRKTTTAENDDDDEAGGENYIDELGRDEAEIVSDHDSDEIDYPDEVQQNDD